MFVSVEGRAVDGRALVMASGQLGIHPLWRNGPQRVHPPAPLPVVGLSRPPIARVTSGDGILPNDHGQVWREYDIRPLRDSAAGAGRPEQKIVDWILRETATKHDIPSRSESSAPSKDAAGLPHARDTGGRLGDGRSLRESANASQMFDMRVVSMASQNRRTKAFKKSRRSGAIARDPSLALPKEDASLLTAKIGQPERFPRIQFAETCSPQRSIDPRLDDASPRLYRRGHAASRATSSGLRAASAAIQRGLFARFQSAIFAGRPVGRCDDPMRRRSSWNGVVPVAVDVPTPIALRQHTEIEVPQTSSYRLRERFQLAG